MVTSKTKVKVCRLEVGGLYLEGGGGLVIEAAVGQTGGRGAAHGGQPQICATSVEADCEVLRWCAQLDLPIQLRRRKPDQVRYCHRFTL